MTVDELLARECIRHTLASYNMAGDRLREDDFVAVFTDDAVLEVEGENGFRHDGIAAIRAWISGWRAGTSGPTTRRAPTCVRHHLTTCLITFGDGDTATARTYFLVCTQIGPDHGGTYLDTLRRTGDRWLIAHRRVRVEWHATEGLFQEDVR